MGDAVILRHVNALCFAGNANQISSMCSEMVGNDFLRFMKGKPFRRHPIVFAEVADAFLSHTYTPFEWSSSLMRLSVRIFPVQPHVRIPPS